MAETVTQIQSAPDYLKPGIEKFLEGATAQAGQAMDTSTFAPSVVGLGALQQQAQQQAATQAGLGTLQFDPTSGAVSGVQGTGVAGFQPFLNEAQRLAGVDPATGQVTATGMESALQPFMSPFQQQVMDATTAAFENRRAQDRLAMADQAVTAGAFGGARQGVQEGVYDAQTNIGLAELQANLASQNFAQAQAGRQPHKKGPCQN